MDNYLKRVKLLKIQKEGVWKSYYANGQLDTRETYEDGKIVAVEVYDDNGNLLLREPD